MANFSKSGDSETIKWLAKGNILAVVSFIIKAALPDAYNYTMTGTSYIITERNLETRKASDYQRMDVTKRLPDELNLYIRRFILESEVLKNETGILQRFDEWMNLVYTRAFNRIRDLRLKHIKAGRVKFEDN